MKNMHGIIFSYEKRNDLRELVDIRTAASIPFGGRYRAVDFALSNLIRQKLLTCNQYLQVVII